MAYDKVTISGNDGKTYVADNAATESTLRELVGVSSRQTSINARTVSQSGAAVGSFTNQLIKSQNGLRYAFASAKEDVMAFGKTIGPLAETMESMFDASMRGGLSASRALTYMGTVAGQAAGGLGDLLKVGGGAAAAFGATKGGIWGKFGAVIGLGAVALGDIVDVGGQAAVILADVGAKVLELTESFAQSFHRLGDSGISVDSSFQSLIESAHDGSMNLDEFANFVSRNRDSLALLGGSVSSGARQITKLSKSIEGSSIQIGFQNLGMQLEDIPDYLAEYSATLRGAGRNLDMSTVASSALSLAQSQRVLSDMTGKSVDALKAEAQQRGLATQVQSKLSSLDADARNRYSAAQAVIAKNYGEEGVKAFQGIFANGRATTTATALFLQQFDSANTLFGVAMTGIEDSSKGAMDITASTFETAKALSGQIENELAVMADFGRYTQLYNGVLGPMLGEIGENIAFNQSLRHMSLEDFNRTIDAAKTASASSDEILESLRNINDGTVTLKTSFQELQTEVVKLAGEPTSNIFNSLADAVKTATTAISDSIRAIDDSVDNSSSLDKSLQQLWNDSFGTLENTGRTVAGGLGGLGGATMGGAIGALLGPFGSAGGVIGGGVIGADAATNAYDLLLEFFGGKKPDEYAFGGISNGPKTGHLELLHGTEAVVPLPDGKSIPISTNSNNTGMNDLINISSKNHAAILALAELSKEMIKQMERNNSIVNRQNYANA